MKQILVNLSPVIKFSSKKYENWVTSLLQLKLKSSKKLLLRNFPLLLWNAYGMLLKCTRITKDFPIIIASKFLLLRRAVEVKFVWQISYPLWLVRVFVVIYKKYCLEANWDKNGLTKTALAAKLANIFEMVYCFWKSKDQYFSFKNWFTKDIGNFLLFYN